MKLSYVTCLLAFGITGATQAYSGNVTDSHTNLITTQNSITYDNYLDGFEAVRFRKRGENDVPVSLWEFDVSNPSDFCYNSIKEVILWRPDAGKNGEELQIVKIDSDKEYSVTWPTKRHTMAWPSSVSLIDGPYLLGIGNATNKISLHKIPSDEADVQKWMEERGCNQQVEILKEMRKNSQPTGI
ncbi:MAG: hypothetical protein IMF12_07045 [Proteobacteria bacterium]|nr:hypothetical protein [Pseudomonadota bacterium]